MPAETIASILEKNGPLALTIVILAVMLFALGAAFIAFVKWSSENTVPVTVYNGLRDCVEAKLDAVHLAVVSK
jgi:hypothetical protein